MKEYTKAAVMNVMTKIIVEQIKSMKRQGPPDEDVKFEIFRGEDELLDYGLADVCEAFVFAERYLENYETIQAEVWKDEASYGEQELKNKIVDLINKTKA